MSNQKLEAGHYYKVISDDVIKVFRVKKWLPSEELEIPNDGVAVYESLIINQDSISVNAWTTLVIDPNYIIEEIDEKTFDKVFKQFNIAKTSILTTLRVKKSV